MSNSHGELFGEIGKLVLAANSGQAIDLGATARDLAERYGELGISEETIANTVARSIGAIGMAMTHVADGGSEATREAIRVRAAELSGEDVGIVRSQKPIGGDAEEAEAGESESLAVANTHGSAAGAKSLFPSGVRLAVLF